MKTEFSAPKIDLRDYLLERLPYLLLPVLFLLLSVIHLRAANYTATVSGNWSNTATWGGAGIPGSHDNVTIHGGITVVADGADSCNNLAIGDATSGNTGITSVSSLVILGALSINPNSINKTYTLYASSGSIYVAGTFPTWCSTTGTNTIKDSVGTITFAPAITISSTNQAITFSAGGTINFNSSFTDNENKLTTSAGCTVNFAGNYTVKTTAASWGGKGTANFTGSTDTINAASNLTLFNLQTAASAGLTLVSAAGTVVIGGAVTLGSGSTFAANENFELDGNWTNNGATFSDGSNTVIFNGTTTLTGATPFANVQMGSTATSVTTALTLDNSITCTGLTFTASTKARTLTVSSGDTLTVNGNATINQPTSNVTNGLSVNAGTCIVTGNLTFSGTTSTANYVSKIAVTTGLLNIEGPVSFAANTTAANQLIALTSTGTITFGSQLSMAYGELQSTSTGTINFNGSSPSFTFGGSNSPSLSVTGNSTLNFTGGFTNNTNALATLAAGSTEIFSGSGTITANAGITFGNLQMYGNDTLASTSQTVTIAGSYTLASGGAFDALQSFQLAGNWTNNGGTMTGSNDTVFLTGAGKTIAGAGKTSFPLVQVGNSSTTGVTYTMNNSNSCSGLIIYGNSHANTLTLGTGDSLTVNGNVTINGPTAAVTNNLLVNGGICIVTGNLSLNDTATSTNYITKVTLTSGSLAVNGSLTYANNTVAANEVITESTGSIIFGSSWAMTSGTLAVTSTGTISFNGASAPSFTFGGANNPILTTTAGCSLNFATGFTNNTNALTLNAGSNTYFTGSGSVIPNAAITFGNVQLDSLVNDTLYAASGSEIVAGSFTLLYNSIFTGNQPLEVRGNWVNNGGSVNTASNPVILNGAAAQTIGGSAATTFPILQMGGTSAANTVNCTVNTGITVDSLVFNGYTKSRTLTVSSGVALTVNGNVNINQPTAAATNNLDVAAGTCTVSGNLNFIGTSNTATFVGKVQVTSGSFTLNGNVNWMSNTVVATEVITVSTGTITFAQSLTMGTGTGTLSVTGAGTVNFNGTTEPSFNFGGAATSPSFTTTAGCNLYFQNGFTNNSVALTLNAGSNTYFTGNGSITPNAQITFGNVQFNASVNDTINSGAGAVIIAGNLTLNSGSSLYAYENYEVDGNWTNNSASISGGAITVFLNGVAQTVSGSPTTFPTLEIGNATAAVNAAVTMACNNTCSALIFQAAAHSRSLTLNSGVTLTDNGNLTINQPTANSLTNLLEVGAGACTVSGNLVFSGANASATRVSQIDVTSGTFSLTGSITWGGSTSTATNVISLNNGTVNFGSDVAMATKSGTLSISGAGTMNFNGSGAPSLSFGGAISPVFNTVSGSNINLKNGLTVTTTPLTFQPGSNVDFRGTGTLTPTAAVAFGNLTIGNGSTLTAAGSFSLTGNWVDSGTFVPSTNSVTLNGSGTQTILRTGGTETFYQLLASSASGLIQLNNNLMVTNSLTMGGENINLNNYTLTLGNNAGASLAYTGGIAYGGTWKRWFPASAITDSSGAYYGLFPIGTSTDYRYVDISSSSNPTTAGYVSATHTDATGATPEHYTDNEGSLIEAIGNMHTDLTVSGLSGGTYNIYVHFTGFSTTGNVADLKLETNTGGVMGSCGTFVVPLGSVSAPTVGRTGITSANIGNRWVMGTDDESATPLYAFYISRKTGNWNDTTTGNGTWALSSDSTMTSCDCVPVSNSYVIIDSATTVTVNGNDSVDFININNGGALLVSSPNTFVVVGEMTLFGTGTFTNNGTMAIGGDLTLPASSSASASSSVSIGYDFIVGSGATYNQTAGTLTASGNFIDTGTVNIGAGASLDLNGSAATISGSGIIYDSLGTVTLTRNKVIAPGSVLTIGTSSAGATIALSSATTVNNEGTVTLYGSITGTDTTSQWTNNANAVLNVTGNVLDTGKLDASIGPNTVNYNGSGSQTITAPSTSYYNLSSTNSGTKSLTTNTEVTNAVTIGGSVVFNEGTKSLWGTAALNMSGSSQLELQRSAEGVYPELAGAYTLTGGTVILDQTADSAVITGARYYNLQLNGKAPFDASAVTYINNNFYLKDSVSLNNNNILTVTDSLVDSSISYTTLQDNLTAAAIIINAGTLDDGGNTITINGAGGWTLNGGNFNTTGQTVFYSKTGVAQTIGGSSPTTFYYLEMNNPTGVILNVNPAAATNVVGYLDLTSGNLYTSSTNLLVMQDTAAVLNGSSTSFVSGPMEKVGNSNFVFPIGKDGIYAKAGISGMQSASTVVTAEYFPQAYSALTPLASNLNQVSNKEYWMIERTVTSDSLQLQLFWTNALQQNIINCPYLTIAHYTGGEWINQGGTALGGSICSGSGSGSIITNGYVSTFSPFTFGSNDGGEALPVALLSFNANPANNAVLTQWTTQTEINNAYFTVERSADGQNFEAVGTVKGAGNSSALRNYEYTDEEPLKGTSYYRLRQTDYNGNSTLSDVVPVSFVVNGSMTVYPNPATSEVFISIRNPGDEVTININDMLGRRIYSKTYSSIPGSTGQLVSLPTAGNLPAGVYLVEARCDEREYTQKLIVK